jgi:ribosomal-protein-serine acetyltransferase
MFPYKVSEGIQLRMLHVRHASELFRLTDANRAHLRQWLPWLDGTRGEKDTAAFISSMRKSFGESGVFACGIWYEAKLCGVVGYNKIDWNNRTGTLGYWLAKPSEGKGIMTACCRAFVSHAFDEYDLNRLVILVATENHRSQAIPDRLGFRKEGILRDGERLYDRYVDVTINALLRGDKPA